MKSGPPRILVYGVSFFTAIGIIFFITNMVGRSSITKHTNGAELDFSYLEEKKTGWDQSLNLLQKIETFRHNWSGPLMKEYAGVDLTENGYIQKEYDRQIEEIQRIFNVEESLKQSEMNRELQEYSKKRSDELELDYKKRSELVYGALNKEFQQKVAEMENLVQNYRRELELEQRQTLVNLNLQLTVLDLNTSQEGIAEKRSRILAEIDKIKQIINQKVTARQDLLHSQLIDYQNSRRQQIDLDLVNYQSKLKSILLHDLELYRGKLESKYAVWFDKQKREFEKAILVRQEQKTN